MNLYSSEHTDIAGNVFVVWSEIEEPETYEAHLLYGLRLEWSSDDKKCFGQYVAIKYGDTYLPLDGQKERMFQHFKSNPTFKECERFLRSKVITDPLQRAHAFCFNLPVSIEEH